MEHEQKKEKRPMMIIIGFLIIIGQLSGGSWRYLSNWSTPELQGMNQAAILFFLLGIYLIIKGFNKKTDISKKLTAEKISYFWKHFNWLFWILLYLFVSINGHIYRIQNMGYLSYESGIAMMLSFEAIILPVLMVALLYLNASVFCSKKIALGIASIGVLMSYNIYSVIASSISYIIYCIILGIVGYGIVRHYKKKAYQEVLQNSSN